MNDTQDVLEDLKFCDKYELTNRTEQNVKQNVKS